MRLSIVLAGLACTISMGFAAADDLNESELPKAVRAALDAKYPGVHIDDIDTLDNGAGYDIDFDYKDHDVDVGITEAGEFLYERTEVELNELPDNIATFVKANYPGARLGDLNIHAEANGNVTFAIEISKSAENKKVDLVLDTKAVVLHKDEEDSDDDDELDDVDSDESDDDDDDKYTDDVLGKVSTDTISFLRRRAGEMLILVDGKPFATYVWSDPRTTRPYFKQVHALGGEVQVTRNHPPRKGDFQDHDTYHPGIWWGFGDVGGNDYWRMKAKIIGGQFVEEPTEGKDRTSFAVRNKLLTNDGGAVFCEQICKYSIVRRTNGILMICESTFVRKESGFWLGDQEEMGLAFRVATPLTQQRGNGEIRDSAGRTALKGIRTNQSDWCDYSGSIQGQHAGIMLMNDPQNFRKPWWHAVDSGLLIANPLGESELTGNGKKRENVFVKKGEPFRLRYGCLIHLEENEDAFSPQQAYREFLTVVGDIDSHSKDTARVIQRSELPTVPTGFSISVFAQEPRVYKPTAVCFDAKGRLVVGQGPQYPKNFETTPTDSVVLVLDSDGDGVADTTKTFATGFNSVQGLAWKGNDLYVANAPELTVVRDLDGDDEADEYIKVYTDLGNREHALHGLNWGPDGKLYMSKGNSKGHNQPKKYGYVAPRPFRELWDVVHPPGAPDSYPPQTFTKHTYKKTYHHWDDDWGREGGVLRCDPMGSNLEIVARGLRNPWDMTMDDGFNFLGSDNDQDQGDRLFMPFYGAHFGWGHSYSSHWTGENHLPTAPISGPVFPGSGTGIIYYTHKALPSEYRDVFFINDWLNGTYVYRATWDGSLMQPQGGQWQSFARRGNGSMLYRPTDMEFAPDGSIYICGWGGDYHYDRQEEGSWIFRVTYGDGATHQSPAFESTAYHDRSVDHLLRDLDSDVIPVRRVNAQDELVRRSGQVVDQLTDAIETGRLTKSQQTWAIWTLARIGPSSPRIVDEITNLAEPNLAAAASGSPLELNLRIQAMRILAMWARGNQHDLPESIVVSLQDPEPRIRFEAVQAIWQSEQHQHVSKLVDRLSSEQDRLVFYAGWQALRSLTSVENRKSLLDHESANVRLAALLSLLEGHEISLDEVLVLAERDSDVRVQNWALTWAMNPIAPVKMPNSTSRIELEESVAFGDLIKRANSAGSPKIRKLYLAMISRATYGDDREDWDEVREFYESLRSDDERASVLKPLARETDALPFLWNALGSSDSLRQAAVSGLASLSRRSGNSPEQVADYLISQMAASAGERSENAAIQAISRLELSEGYRPSGDWDRVLATAFTRTNNVATKAEILKLLLVISPSLAPQGDQIKDALEASAKDHSPRIYSLLSALNARWGMNMELQAPKKATIAGVLDKLATAGASRGRELFFNKNSTNCAACHRISGRGTSLAPDLSSVGLRNDSSKIAQSILEPSATITEGYQMQTFVLDDGQSLSGAVLSETNTELRVVTLEGEVRTIDASGVDDRSKQNVSAMPTGFALLGDEQIADIVAFLVTCREGVASAKLQ